MTWARLGNAALGIWLMAAPAVLGYAGAAEVNDRIVGPVAATFALVAIAAVMRPLRWVNTVVGGWLLVAPWLLGYDATRTIVNDLLVGVLLIAFSLVKGTVEDRFAGGWSSLWRDQELLQPGEQPQG